MDFRTRRVLFGSPFFMIFEFFILKYLSSLFIAVPNMYLIVMAVLLEIIHVLPVFTERRKSDSLGRFLATFYGVWEWFLVMLLIYLIIIYSIGSFIALPMEFIIFTLIILCLIGAYSYVHAHNIIIKEHTLEFDKLTREYNIIQLSDVHFGSVRHKDIIKDIVNKIKEYADDCDLVIISGDLVDGSSVVEEDDLLEFRNVKIPVIFTSGNHDYYPGIENVHRACEKADMIILENQSYEYDDLNIYGLSYSFGDIPMPTLDELKSYVKDDKINIINYHIPNGWDIFRDIGFDLQLSGHTHGGQFYPVIFFGKLLYEGHNMGLFKKEDDNSRNQYLHVTTGVGSMDIPMRWGTDSEIIILKLRKN